MGRKCRAEHQNLTVCFWKFLSSLRMAFPRCCLVPRAQHCSRILGATVRTECRNFFPVRRPCPGPLLNTATEQAGPREPRPVSVLSVSPVPCRLCSRRSHVGRRELAATALGGADFGGGSNMDTAGSGENGGRSVKSLTSSKRHERLFLDVSEEQRENERGFLSASALGWGDVLLLYLWP